MAAIDKQIRVGIGGWSYEPWRATFYPADVKPKDQLAYASRRVTAIEINSTFYRLQKPAVFAKWRDSTPDDFLFCVKAPRFVTHRRRLSEGTEGARRFIASGISELGIKLGPLLWQLPPEHVFDGDDVGAFLDELPDRLGGQRLRHALNVRHESFRDPVFIECARRRNIAVVFEDDAAHPAIADLTSDFVYARLRRCQAAVPTGYSDDSLLGWKKRALAWRDGEDPADLPHVAATQPGATQDVFVFFINGAKERAPAAAQRLIFHLNAQH